MKQRASRVAEELKKIISQILLEDLTDPRLGFITIIHIEVTDDLRYARVYYSVLGEEEKKESSAEALQDHLGFIRHLVAQRIHMKFALEIKFEVDKSIDQSFRIDSVIKKIKESDEKNNT